MTHMYAIDTKCPMTGIRARTSDTRVKSEMSSIRCTAMKIWLIRSGLDAEDGEAEAPGPGEEGW
jgi:hypothetical protein